MSEFFKNHSVALEEKKQKKLKGAVLCLLLLMWIHPEQLPL